MSEQPDLFNPSIVQLAQTNAARFTDEFLEWLPDNLHVWAAFEREAFAAKRKGFDHYSARTIIEFLRHHSAVHEQGGEWKLNNNYPPYLARLFDMAHPKAAGLFEYRVTKKVVTPSEQISH